MPGYDYIVIGAGSGGCAAAHGLAMAEAGRVLVIEAGPEDDGLLVRVPMGLIWLMGGRRDWALRSAPQAALGGRSVAIPRGRMVGGSSSINSMVWFRGRREDFDGWGVAGWRAADVWPAFEEVEAEIRPARHENPHPLSEAIARHFGGDTEAAPTPEAVSGSVCHYNMRRGRRWSAADAFLRPAMQTGRVHLRTYRQIDRLRIERGRATGVVLRDGSVIAAGKGVVLAAGSIGSPEIVLRSGLGPADELRALGIDVLQDSPGVGRNLHDHPAVPVHHAGRGSGYGLTLGQAAHWALAPLRYATTRGGPFASPTVEACAFLAASGGESPDVQVHFIPFMLGWQGRAIVPGSGYYADVCVSRPRSRGELRLRGRDPGAGSEIDLGLLSDPADMELLVSGFRALRALLAEAPFGRRRAPEAFPGPKVDDEAAIRTHIRNRAGTAYHPVGTLAMGEGEAAPVTPRLALRGVEGAWVADASVMPSITSANTNAPAMMIGHRAARFIVEDAA